MGGDSYGLIDTSFITSTEYYKPLTDYDIENYYDVLVVIKMSFERLKLTMKRQSRFVGNPPSIKMNLQTVNYT